LSRRPAPTPKTPKTAPKSLSPPPPPPFSLLLAVYTDTLYRKNISVSYGKRIFWPVDDLFISRRTIKIRTWRRDDGARNIAFILFHYYYFLISICFIIYSFIRFSRPSGLRRHEIFAKRIFFRGSGFQNNIVPKSRAYTNVPAPTAHISIRLRAMEILFLKRMRRQKKNTR